MDSSYDITVVIPTCPHRIDKGRRPKLRALLEGIASTSCGRDRFEVIVVVDELDESPLALAQECLPGICFRGFTQSQQGPARARNHAIEHARGRWLLFYDDDALVDAETIPGHLNCIRQNAGQAHRCAGQPLAYLGRVDWPVKLLTSPWARLLSETSMLFFWDQMKPDRTYGFRHFWTSNLCVRTEWVRSVGGFDELFPSALHEDIELGWRLAEKFGMRVQPVMSINSWHDHAITPTEYFVREHSSGVAAASCRTINREFHDAVWGWVNDSVQTADMLRQSFVDHESMTQFREVLDMLERWTVQSSYQPTSEELQATYSAHLPLKRMMFRCGYAGVPFDEVWSEIDPALAKLKTPSTVSVQGAG